MIYLQARDMPGPLTVTLCRLCGFQVPLKMRLKNTHTHFPIIPAAYCLSQLQQLASGDVCDRSDVCVCVCVERTPSMGGPSLGWINPQAVATNFFLQL